VSKKQNLTYFSPSIVRRYDKNKRIYYIDKSSGKKRDKKSWLKSLEYRKNDDKFITVIKKRKNSDFNFSEKSISVFVYELKRLSNLFLFAIKKGSVTWEGVKYNKENSFVFLNKLKRKITELYALSKTGLGSSLVKAEIEISKTMFKIIDIYS